MSALRHLATRPVGAPASLERRLAVAHEFGDEVSRVLLQLRIDELLDEVQVSLASVRSSRDRVRQLLEAKVGIGSGLDLEAALTKIVQAATALVDARYGALGVVGADITVKPDGDPLEVVRAVTGGLGADVVMEAVGTPGTFELCATLARPGGRIANIGVHGKSAVLHLEDLWIRNITITTGLVDTSTTPVLLRMLEAGQLDVSHMVTHRFALDDFAEAYQVFADPAHTGALKVVLTRH
jgi:D-arabinose 1-dehydrogenase-like Zn-dependent alcohol dehydrogenase